MAKRIRHGLPIKKYEQAKVFRGKRFKFIDRYERKADALKLQSEIKKRGHLARVMKSKYGYEVWANYISRR